MTPNEKSTGPPEGASPATETAKPGGPRTAGKKKASALKPSRRIALAAELTEALNGLRVDLRECVNQYIAENEGRVNAALARLNGGETAGERPILPPVKVSRHLLDEIRALNLKPEKGRVKDLQRLKQAAEKAARAIAELE